MPNVEGVLELYKEVFKPETQRDSKRLKKEVQKLLGDPDYRLFTVEQDGKVASSVMAVIIRNLVGLGRDFMIIENIATLPKYQGKGLASKLLADAEAWAKERNCFKIIIISNVKFAVTGFYHKLGFEEHSSEVFIKHL